VRGEQLLVHLRLQMADQPTRTLASGAEMPVLGLGVWQVAAGTEWALEAGYRLIDTAALYRNEESVGGALRRSALPRERYALDRQTDRT
jgi:diketogulonate reductase-like aldo/keto reductase